MAFILSAASNFMNASTVQTPGGALHGLLVLGIRPAARLAVDVLTGPSDT